MNNKQEDSKQTAADAAVLRKRAEEQARSMESPALSTQPREDAQRVFHELQVHQIELEMQNEDLRRVLAEIEAGRERYINLYDLAPVGYCTLSEKGLILEANLTAATLLGTARSALVKQPISRFILQEDQDIYYLYRKQLFETGEPQEFELRLIKPDGASFWTHLTATAAQAEDGEPLCFVVISDITTRKEAEDQIRFQADIIENAPLIVAYHDKNLDMLWANRAYRKATGLSLEEVRAKQCWKVWNLSGPCRGCPVITAIETGESAASELTPDNQDHWPETQGSWLCQAAPVRDEQGTVIGAVEFAIDITERKRADTHREMGREILQILNEPGDLQESMQRVLAELKTRIGVDAVGLRLQEGEDYPYFAEDGFPPDFLQSENSLLERDKDGGVCRDEDGHVSLECTCGLILCGKTDPSNPIFTQGGSCWTNDSSPFLDLPPDQDPRLHPRNNCIHQGYASVALIPVRASDRIVGLIQLNDERKGRFTLETIGALEGISAHIGAALMRKRAEQTLRERDHEAQRTASRLQLVGDVGARILIRVRLDAVGQAVYEQCKELMPVDAFWIGLLDKRTDRISFPFGFKDGERRSPPERSMEESPGLFGHVLKLGSTLYVSDMPNSALAATWVVQPGSRTHSAVCVPFVLDENACGVFSVQSNEPDAYTQEHVEILGLLSAQIVLAIANTRTHEATQRGLESTLTALSHVAEKRDPYTAGHQERVTTLALAIARRLGLGDGEQNTLRMAGMLHDIGKISVPTEILSKPGTLNDLEFRMIQEHPKTAYDILVDSDFPVPVAEIVYSHHERLDGTGYPRKLSGDDISLEARILAVADTVEAMTSHRPYRPAPGIEAACTEIRRGRGTVYDADAVDACLAIVQSDEFSFEPQP